MMVYRQVPHLSGLKDGLGNNGENDQIQNPDSLATNRGLV